MDQCKNILFIILLIVESFPDPHYYYLYTVKNSPTAKSPGNSSKKIFEPQEARKQKNFSRKWQHIYVKNEIKIIY